VGSWQAVNLSDAVYLSGRVVTHFCSNNKASPNLILGPRVTAHADSLYKLSWLTNSSLKRVKNKFFFSKKKKKTTHMFVFVPSEGLDLLSSSHISEIPWKWAVRIDNSLNWPNAFLLLNLRFVNYEQTSSCWLKN